MENNMKKHIHGGNIYQYEGCLDFSANLNPLGLPKGIRQAVIDSLDQADLYPEVGYAPLREAIGAYEGVPADQVICGNGAAELIYTLCRAVKAKKALLAAPTFAEYEQALLSVDCDIRHSYLDETTGFQIGETFLEEITEELDMVFLCNPNNPTGLLLSRDFLQKILTRCEEKNVLLVVDECFLDFVKDPGAYTLVEHLASSRHLFLLKAFTKRYAMAGIRLGYGLCGNGALLEQMNRMVQPWNISVMAQAAGIAALKETEYVQAGRQVVFEESAYLKKELRALELKVYDSAANYIFFTAPESLFEEAAKRGILIRNCSNYEGLCPGYFRIAVRTHAENLRLVEVFREIFK
jgi:threonine-phosphate decarboxylase